MTETVSRRIPGTNRLETWDLEEVLKKARGLPTRVIRIVRFDEVKDPQCWLYHLPDRSHPLVAREWDEMMSVTRDPLIIHPSGWVMVGYHRLGKSILEGCTAVTAIQFTDENLPPLIDF